jgi:hypothetical protein
VKVLYLNAVFEQNIPQALRSITPRTQKPFGVIRAILQENQLALWNGYTALQSVLPFQEVPSIPFFDVSAGRPVFVYLREVCTTNGFLRNAILIFSNMDNLLEFCIAPFYV